MQQRLLVDMMLDVLTGDEPPDYVQLVGVTSDVTQAYPSFSTATCPTSGRPFIVS